MTDAPATVPRRLWIFLCHASCDKPAVRRLYRLLRQDGFEPWLDEEDLLPGQVWESAIRNALRESDVVLVCLSQSAVTKKGFVQKEIRFALDAADEQPEGTIYIIPVKLEECRVPERLAQWQWVNLKDGYEELLRSLRTRAGSLGLQPISRPDAIVNHRGRITLPDDIKNLFETPHVFVTTLGDGISRIYDFYAWEAAVANFTSLRGDDRDLVDSVLFVANMYGAHSEIDNHSSIQIPKELREQLGYGGPIYLDVRHDRSIEILTPDQYFRGKTKKALERDRVLDHAEELLRLKQLRTTSPAPEDFPGHIVR